MIITKGLVEPFPVSGIITLQMTRFFAHGLQRGSQMDRFDWENLAIGLGFTVMFGLLIAAQVMVLSNG